MSLIRHVLPVFAVAACFSAFTGCSDQKADQATVTDAQKAPALPVEAVDFKVDTEKSKMQWIGAKITANHNGTVSLRDGSISVKENKIVGGRFVFDMATLRAEDLEIDEPSNKKLTGHLMSPDFFDVAHHPTVEFEITAVEPIATAVAEADSVSEKRKKVVQNNVSKIVTDATHLVTGNLIIKGVAKSITFPARINLSDTTATATANFIIDRTDWGLNYMSEDSFADKMIFKEVNIILDIVANK
ncbi:MAG: YceI family protein [Chitinophagaceae bacterium]|nr:MAG: YceI family protein [Chitinophagaceae bacterium]